MVILFTIAFISLGGSYLVFWLASTGGVWGTTNNGELITPQTTVRDIGLHLPEEEGRAWWLWTNAATCDAQCQTAVQKIRALHVLLNREAGRVRRGITLGGITLDGITPGGETGGTSQATSWLDAYPALHRVKLAHTSVEAPAEGLYIIDPNGNLVLRYDISTDPKLILQDLKKLLKVSQIG